MQSPYEIKNPAAKGSDFLLLRYKSLIEPFAPSTSRASGFRKVTINKIYQDEFGRKSGILLIDKPQGYTSHDIVNIVRREFNIKKVGHAGALDPFATGLLVILVGKATTLSDSFLGLDKEYEAEILFGVSTDTGDPTGQIKNAMPTGRQEKLQIQDGNIPLNLPSRGKTEGSIIDPEKLESVIKSFQPEYKQYVPVFSSVKVNGEKLRKLARKYDEFEVVDENGEKVVRFYDRAQKTEVRSQKSEVRLPSKVVKIYDVQLLELKQISGEELNKQIFRGGEEGRYDQPGFWLPTSRFFVARINVRCSKGTYIRQLAVDIGEKLGVPAMLVNLRRTRIGEYTLDNVYDIKKAIFDLKTTNAHRDYKENNSESFYNADDLMTDLNNDQNN